MNQSPNSKRPNSKSTNSSLHSQSNVNSAANSANSVNSANSAANSKPRTRVPRCRNLNNDPVQCSTSRKTAGMISGKESNCVYVPKTSRCVSQVKMNEFIPAVIKSDYSKVEQLLKYGISPNFTFPGSGITFGTQQRFPKDRTPLFQAIKNKDLKMCQLLLKYKAKISQEDLDYAKYQSDNNKSPNNTSSQDIYKLLTANTHGGSKKEYKIYKNRKYVIKYGPRGGKYIQSGGEKIRFS